MRVFWITASFILQLHVLAAGQTNSFSGITSDVKAEGSTPQTFLLDAMNLTESARLLRDEGCTSEPFYILYKGNQSLLPYHPAMKPDEMLKVRYQVNDEQTELVKALSDELSTINSDIETTITGNIMMVSERSVVGNANWPLGQPVEETKERSLSLKEALNLLSSKYGLDSTNTHMAFQYCEREELISQAGQTLTVEELLIRMLNRAADSRYRETPNKNWVVLYQISRNAGNAGEAPQFRLYVYDSRAHKSL